MSDAGRVDVKTVLSRSELREFIKFPFRLYRNDPNWVPPLIVDRLAFFDRKKNPFYETAETELFLAYRNGDPVGRIAACVNHDYNEFHGEKAGVFGFFEAIEDESVALTLLDAAAEWLKARGMTRMMGPFNFSTNHEVGLLADGFDVPPAIMMTYNPPYYLRLCECWGMTKAKDLLAFWLVQDSPPSDRIRKIAARVRERSRVTVRRLDMSNFGQEIELVRQIYNQAWSRNWGFVPLREAEFAHMAKDMKLIVDRDLAFIAEADGRPVGFCLTLPNVYEVQRKIRSGRLFPTGLFRLLWALKVAKSIHSTRIITMGVIHEYQKRGIESVFYVESFDRGTAKGYESGEISWILEDNELMIKAAEALGAKRYKTYRIYEKALT